MNAGYLKVIDLVPAAAGWRRVYWSLPPLAHEDAHSLEDVEKAPASELLIVRPIACFVHGHIDGGDGFDSPLSVILPVIAEDWPAELAIEYETSAGDFGVDILGPGEELTKEHENEARERAVAYVTDRGARHE